MAKAPDLRGLCFFGIRRVPVALREYRTDAAVAASETEAASSPAYWVCLALLLAMAALAARIASIW